MRQFSILLLGIIFLSGCSKILLDKKFEKKILGTWQVKQIQNLNGSTNYSLLNFRAGELTFREDADFRFLDTNGDVYGGSWYIDNIKTQTNCYTAPDGSTVCTDDWNTTLQVKAKCTANQQTKSAYFEWLTFYGNEKLVAHIHINGVIFYEYTFERKH